MGEPRGAQVMGLSARPPSSGHIAGATHPQATVAGPALALPLINLPEAANAEPVFNIHSRDGMERGSLFPVELSTSFNTDRRSISERFRCYYERYPEAHESVLVVYPACADAPTRFESPQRQSILRFILTASASGLSHKN